MDIILPYIATLLGDSFAKTKITITGGTFDGDVALTGGSSKAPMETVEVSDKAIFLGEGLQCFHLC